MEFKTKYDPEEFVYLVHDPDQQKRWIVEITVTKKTKSYLLRCGSDESMHDEGEISRKRNQTIAFDLKEEE